MAAFLWKTVMERAQCSIAGAESHGLLIGAVLFFLLGLAILICACCVLDGRAQERDSLSNYRASPGHLDANSRSRSAACHSRSLEGLAAFEAGVRREEGGRSGGGGGGGKGKAARIFSVPCLMLNLSIASTLVAGALFYTASFAHRAPRFEMLDSELKLKWGIGDDRAPGANFPLWVGEFGKPASAPSVWWKHLMRFFSENPEVGWAYWPLNGAKWRNESYDWEDETYGILEMDYLEPRNPSLVSDLMATLDGTLANSSALSPGGWGGRQDDFCCSKTPSVEGCADECIED